jgi:hypothetical protein
VSELRVGVAGCPFVLTPAEALTDDERRALARLDGHAIDGRPFVLHLRESHLDVVSAPCDGEPASISVHGDEVFVIHERFAASIDPFAYAAEVHRGDTTDGSALEIVLRTALGCRLPLEEGLLLHSAGIVLDGGAYLFHGVSGAGKSTFAGFMRDVLSDEVVAVQRGVARATGFWGTLDAADAPSGAYPLRALVELARGDGVSLERITARAARRALLLVAVVPPHARLWMETLRVIEQLSAMPAFRLAWTPSHENAERVLTALR